MSEILKEVYLGLGLQDHLLELPFPSWESFPRKQLIPGTSVSLESEYVIFFAPSGITDGRTSLIEPSRKVAAVKDYCGLIGVQALLGPIVDITDSLTAAYARSHLGLYRPETVLARPFGFKAWLKDAQAEFEFPQLDTLGSGLAPDSDNGEGGIIVITCRTNLVFPDTQLNRSYALGTRQGAIGIKVTNDSFPGSINELVILLGWGFLGMEEISVADQRWVHYHAVHSQIGQIDAYAAALYERDFMARFGKTPAQLTPRAGRRK